MKAIPYQAVETDRMETGTSNIKAVPKEDNDNEVQDANLEFINNFKLKIRNYRIVIVFMAIMILVPFGVLAYDKIFSQNASEQALVNEYASWKEELTKKEQELNEREKLFEGMNEQKINSEKNTNGEENGKSQNSGS